MENSTSTDNIWASAGTINWYSKVIKLSSIISAEIIRIIQTKHAHSLYYASKNTNYQVLMVIKSNISIQQ